MTETGAFRNAGATPIRRGPAHHFAGSQPAAFFQAPLSPNQQIFDWGYYNRLVREQLPSGLLHRPPPPPSIHMVGKKGPGWIVVGGRIETAYLKG